MTKYFVGLDLGQAADYSALTIAERHNPPAEDPKAPVRYTVGYMRRFDLGTPYPTIVADVVKLMSMAPLLDDAVLIIDGTGVGRPVVDMFNLHPGWRPIPILITGGDTPNYDQESGFWRVPKRDLVSVVQVLLQSKRLEVSSQLALADVLVKELLSFKVKINVQTKHDSYGAWREGTHDDLVLSLAMALWWAPRHVSARDLISVVEIDDEEEEEETNWLYRRWN